MYIIDTNVLIEAKNRYYAFDLAPGFWEWLDLHHHEGTLASIEQVKSEIIRGNDKLSEWAKEHPDFFLPFDAPAVEALRGVTSWAVKEYPESAANEFLHVADPPSSLTGPPTDTQSSHRKSVDQGRRNASRSPTPALRLASAT